MKWQIIDSGDLSPAAIMAKDADLLSQLTPLSSPILHLYEWDRPCLTYGYFTCPADYLHLDTLERYGIEAVRRPTGGGIIFHLTDLAFSLLIPVHHPKFSLNTLDNYAFINQHVAQIVAHFAVQQKQPELLIKELNCLNSACQGFCMAKPTQYDLMREGKKVGGAAQRRTKQGLLHHASLSLTFPPENLLREVLRNHAQVLPAMQENSDYLLSSQVTQKELKEARRAIKQLLMSEIPML
jgi:lipoate-protein ligase A